MQTKALAAILVLSFLSLRCTSIQVAPENDYVEGVWSGQPWGLVEVRTEGDIFRMFQLSERFQGAVPGSFISEFHFDKEFGVYTGRHKWGTDRWGKEGGVRIDRINDDQFTMFYLDSIYTGGWTFSRVVPSSGQEAGDDLSGVQCEYVEVLSHETASCNARPELALVTRSQEEALFFMDYNRLSEIAIQEVHRAYPEIPTNGLEAGESVSVSCHRSSLLEKIPPDQQQLGVCQAQTSVTVKSGMVEEKITEADGTCKLVIRTEPISVTIFPDGSARVGNRGGSSRGSRSVNCSDDIAALSE